MNKKSKQVVRLKLTTNAAEALYQRLLKLTAGKRAFDVHEALMEHLLDVFQLLKVPERQRDEVRNADFSAMMSLPGRLSSEEIRRILDDEGIEGFQKRAGLRPFRRKARGSSSKTQKEFSSKEKTNETETQRDRSVQLHFAKPK